jgi:hypothetical protein
MLTYTDVRVPIQSKPIGSYDSQEVYQEAYSIDQFTENP